ncbi:putative LRR receptor-like serine/threonine-protein kinase [Arachis hypogaea]|nr:putative LRR receptor-like serine/threonine-protein kinase [Arachis hypogaea]
MAMELHRGVFVTLITLFFFVQFGFSSTTTTATETERQALVQLRKSLGISRLAPKTGEPESILFNNLTSSQQSALDSHSLTNLTFLPSFCSLTGSIPSSLGGLTELTFLSLSGNELTGRLPSELGRLSGLTVLDLSDNSLTGTVPNTVSSLRYLTRIDLSRNFLSGLSSLVTLDLSKNSLSGSLPSVLFSILFKLEVLILNENAFDGTIPATLWSGINLQFLDLSGYKITGPLPKLATSNNVNYSGATFNVSNNLLYGSLNNILLSKFKVIDLSNNYFQGEVQIGGFNNDVTALARNCLRMIPNQRNFGVCYFQGEVQIGGFNNDVTALARNCLRMIPNQRNFGACRVFYVQRRLAFSPGSAQGPAQSPLQNSKSRNNKEVIFILVGIFVGLGFIMILIPVLVVLLKRGENHGSIITIQRQRGTTNVGTDPEVENPTAPPKDHEFKASLGESFSYEQMLHFTYNFAEANLIKHGR